MKITRQIDAAELSAKAELHGPKSKWALAQAEAAKRVKDGYPDDAHVWETDVAGKIVVGARPNDLIVKMGRAA